MAMSSEYRLSNLQPFTGNEWQNLNVTTGSITHKQANKSISNIEIIWFPLYIFKFNKYETFGK